MARKQGGTASFLGLIHLGGRGKFTSVVTLRVFGGRRLDGGRNFLKISPENSDLLTLKLKTSKFSGRRRQPDFFSSSPDRISQIRPPENKGGQLGGGTANIRSPDPGFLGLKKIKRKSDDLDGSGCSYLLQKTHKQA